MDSSDVRGPEEGARAVPAREETPVGAEVEKDVQRLHELGYKQELSRAWSGFTNFAISFTIISVLAGTFTTFGTAWANGGPVVISIGWPVICGFVLLVALSMAELTSAYPTAGGPYWWAAKLGGPQWSWYTGWFNIVGLVGIVASVGYGAATFLNTTLRRLRGRHLRDQLRRYRALPRRDLAAVRADLGLLHAGEHLRRQAPGHVQQHLRGLARSGRRGGDRPARVRSRRPPGLQLRLR